MPKPLVIVESPAKAKTIAGFLGSDFVVESSIGHVRDLPRSAADVPSAFRGEPWARLGVDVDNDFKPLYVVAKEKKSQIQKLKAALKDASELYLATDEDREGESIAWHLLEVLTPRVPVKRMVFHEITPQAIEAAVDNYRDLDRRLVDAQEARRILDRLYGYEVSPVLWKKVMPRLSAGRVQSVAIRMVVERERARMRFRAGSWWDIAGTFEGGGEESAGGTFEATLVGLDGRRLATGRDFDESGQLAGRGEVALLDEAGARGLAERLEAATFAVTSVEEKPYRRSPYAPFMTSTLQQEAGRKLRFSSQRTMQAAQRLYESGYITYMRTDSTALSESALESARAQARAMYGDDYVPDRPRRHERKVKNAQEAHEAIRPAGDHWPTPEEMAGQVGADERRIYELVWKRTVASQMADARGTSAQVRLVGRLGGGDTGPGDPGTGQGPESAWREVGEAEFSASGKVITFPGFLRAYVEGADDPEAQLEDQENRLPPLATGDPLTAHRLEPEGHTTQPPARYTEASLVKALEEMGVGRPSTYASIIGTIQERGYVWKKGAALVPSFVAFAVVELLVHHFAELVDYGFTASMEDDLDEIARGEEEAVPWLTRFYFGNGRPGLKGVVAENLGEIDAREVNSIPVGTDAEGRAVVVRVGRYGPYLQRGEERASVPEDLAPDELTLDRAESLLQAPSGDRVLGDDPETGLPVLLRSGRFGPYVQLGEAGNGSKAKPTTASLLRSMDPAEVTLEEVLPLLRLPRVVGTDPSDGQEILAYNGRYGPYLRKGNDSRSLEDEDQLFTVTQEDAVARFAQAKTGRGRRAPAPPLRELGPDPTSGAPIVVREGRFGPYVTDGQTNASLRTGDTTEGVTLERAAELLAEKRAKGPATGTKKAGATKKGGTKAAGAAKKGATKKASGTKKAGATKKAGGTKKGTGARRSGGSGRGPSGA